MDQWCTLEPGRFAASEFRDDPKLGRVHKALPEHTVHGELLTPSEIPVVINVNVPTPLDSGRVGGAGGQGTK